MEISCGGIVFREEREEKYFLIVQSKKNEHWLCPKGHLEEGESEIECAKREIFEETGISELQKIKNFEIKAEYSTKEGNTKKVFFFLFRTNEENLTPKDDVKDAKWLTFNEAYNLITFDETKQAFKKAYDFLSEK